MANRDYSQPFLNHYHIKTPFPVEWPVEIDSDNEELDNIPPISRARDATPQSPPPQSPPPQSRRKSVYAILERPSYRQQFKKPEIADVIEADDTNPVEARDPLGSQERVLDALRRRGLPVDDDAQLRMQQCMMKRVTASSTDQLSQGITFFSPREPFRPPSFSPKYTQMPRRSHSSKDSNSCPIRSIKNPPRSKHWWKRISSAS